ncbi:hypothetical protein SEUCBS139899_009193 [Sporothrix eucalyptigena]|uniref:GH16 domain-containing protein n=1 Tax=Sporothrix eucalyptigena TaxID=1812306 RepID=A0ABP0BZK1_9PEZI
MHFSTLLSAHGLIAAAVLLSGLAAATKAPTYPGYSLIWQDSFVGTAGSSPSQANWQIIKGYLNVNGEAEVYSDSNSNLQLSGGGTIQLVPQKDPSKPGATAGWTSARIVSTLNIRPYAGGVTRIEGSIRMGANPASQKQGIWPAFWLLGASNQVGTKWPDCGELDIMEQRNGVQTGFGTVHCGNVTNGGTCNEPNGIGGSVAIPASRKKRDAQGTFANATVDANDNSFHVWTITWDLTNSNWLNQKIEWAVDGRNYFSIAGQRINDQKIWNTLTQDPYNIIFNVAVGGGFPGAPNSATKGGYGSMMEVQYVAVYSSS